MEAGSPKIQPRTVRIGLGILLVVGLAIFGLVKLLGDGGGDSDNGGSSETVGPVVVAEDELSDEVGAAGHPVYWLGPVPGIEDYEFTSTEGRAYIRYVPPGTEPGDERPDFLSVGTYPVPDAISALNDAAASGGSKGNIQQKQGYSLLENRNGRSAYIVFEDQPDLQIEIYDPTPGKALEYANRAALRVIE